MGETCECLNITAKEALYITTDIGPGTSKQTVCQTIPNFLLWASQEDLLTLIPHWSNLSGY